ncbi:MAG: methyltransferase domain-containing protein [Candidatus Tectomicrobia bacterium]|uniref:Methyltransferase domain-containing protein n=1 Tax=Tectimicrobiota bacterium TaxID=2528274 RepID=A0A932MM11_UNCTE|nr:methyltransferase domain-containing protein [Candidatus Tectomicrobia bacterium]
MAGMFSNAAAYDGYMGRWSAKLAPLFLDFAGIHDGGRLLDVGCGTGALCRAAAEAAPRSEVVGVDPAQAFIEHARAQCTDPRITYDLGDALNLSYPDDSFDQSLSLLVFMFIPQGERAAGEMRRVTRPGGAVAACTWDSGDGKMELASTFWEEAVRLDPAAEARRADKTLRYNRRGELGALWKGIGLEGVEETAIGMRMEFASFGDYWLPLQREVGPIGTYAKGLSPEARDALRGALRARFLGGGPDGPFTLRARAWAARGTVPG